MHEAPESVSYKALIDELARRTLSDYATTDYEYFSTLILRLIELQYDLDDARWKPQSESAGN